MATVITEPVKRGKSAYMFFCAEERASVTHDHPDLGNKDIMRKLGERWTALKAAETKASKERLSAYEVKAKEDQERYQREKALAPPAEKKPKKAKKPKVEEDEEEEEIIVTKKKTTTKPKAEPAAKAPAKKAPAKKTVKIVEPAEPAPKKVSGYINFAKENRADVKAEMPELPASEVSKELGRRWKALSADEQAEYK